MTVSELRDRPSELPPDTPVLVLETDREGYSGVKEASICLRGVKLFRTSWRPAGRDEKADKDALCFHTRKR
jgi:hypothetical protein